MKVKLLDKFNSLTRKQKLEVAGLAVLAVGGTILTVVCVKNHNDGVSISDALTTVVDNVHYQNIVNNGEKIGAFVDFMEGDDYVTSLQIDKNHVEEALQIIAASSKKVVEGISQDNTLAVEVTEF